MKKILITIMLMTLTACGGNNSDSPTEAEIQKQKAMEQEKADKIAAEEKVKNEAEALSKKAAILEQKLREELDALAKKQNLIVRTPPAIPDVQGQKTSYTLLKQNYYGLKKRTSQVYKNPDSYKNLLKLANIDDLSTSDIDFAKHQVAVFAEGHRGRLGEKVFVTKVIDIGSAIRMNVLYQEVGISNDKRCEYSTAVGYPWTMIAVNSTKPIIISEVHDRDCRASLTPIPYPGDERAIGYKVLHSSDEGPDLQYEARSHIKQTSPLTLDGEYGAKKYAEVLKKYTTQVPQDIDKRQQVLLIDRGVKSSSGYGIQIDGVTENKEQATVHITYTDPAESCSTGSAMTVPYKFVLVNSIKPIAVHERLAIDNDCGS